MIDRELVWGDRFYANLWIDENGCDFGVFVYGRGVQLGLQWRRPGLG